MPKFCYVITKLNILIWKTRQCIFTFSTLEKMCKSNLIQQTYEMGPHTTDLKNSKNRKIPRATRCGWKTNISRFVK